MKRIFIYGLGGTREQYRTLWYSYLTGEAISVRSIIEQANFMRIKNPSIEYVYIIDDRRGLRGDYMESVRQNSIESCVIFKDILEREGIQIF